MTSPALKVAAQVRSHKDNGPVHVGPIRSKVAGRTDHHPMQVPSGSYVLPADVISGLGEGNTEAGIAVVNHMFPKAKPGKHEKIPIMAAGGEVVLSPDQIIKRFGDLDRGHQILDAWVKHQRDILIHTLKNLPGPAQS